jgi:CheY-like chemotaxis protein
MPERHILLLDPNGGNRRNLAFLLHLAGYRVTEVGAGDEALNRLALCGGGAGVDLLLVCLGEPGLDLVGLLDWRRHRQLPMLIVSEQVGILGRPTGTAAPLSCRRREVIETLAGLWRAETLQSPNPAPAAVPPQEP